MHVEGTWMNEKVTKAKLITRATYSMVACSQKHWINYPWKQ